MVETCEYMSDEYLSEYGYKKYNPIPLDNEHIVARFQKRFDDSFGKKYFINVLKWSNEYIPKTHRGQWWTPFSHEYEVQVEISNDENPLRLHFFSSWSLKNVENFMEDFFEKMHPNYYERWDSV